MQRIQKTIAEFVMKTEMVTVKPNDSVEVAVQAMHEQSSDCVLIVDAGTKLVGIFTERDFLNRVAAERRDPSLTPISEVMTPDPETLRESDCMTYAINRMAVRGFRNVPILGDDGRPKSVLDVRLVMMHLIKVFAEVDRDEQGHPPEPETEDEWVDIGGG